MNNVLGTQSYMDKLVPLDITLNLLDKDVEKNMSQTELINYYYPLEQYILLIIKTYKWHKNGSDIIKKNINILNNNEKNNLKQDELISYYNKLKKYYIEIKNIYNHKNIKRLSQKEEKKLSDDEYAIYLKELRMYDDSSKINNMELKNRKKLNPFLRKMMKVSRIASGIKVIKLNTKLPTEINNRPIIFVLTHVGKDDIAVFNEAITKHYTILSGDYESLHNNIEGFVTILNGVEFFDMRSKTERKEIEKKVVQKLKSGDNILCSMEAAWNLSPNIPVLELFPGMINAAINSNAVIISVGIERFNKKLYGINVGKKIFDPKVYNEKYKNKEEMLEIAKNELRQIMADIKMELYFDKKIIRKIETKRSEIGDYNTYNDQFKQDILNDWTFTQEAIEEKSFRSKNNPKYVYSYLPKLYNDLPTLYDMINDHSLSSFERERLTNLFKNKLIRLNNEINSETYPNEIKDVLRKQYSDIVLKINSEESFEKKINTAIRR